MKRIQLDDGHELFGIDVLTAQYIYNEIYRDNVYLKHGVEVKDGDTVFDIGANIGLFAKYICEKYKDLNVYTFEPVPLIFEALEANLAEFHGNLHNVNKGLGEAQGEIDMLFFPKVSGDSAIVPVEFNRKINMFVDNFDETIAKFMPSTKKIPKFLRSPVLRIHRKLLYRGKKVRIKLTTVSDIIDQYDVKQIDLVKLDAENYEWQVLQGIRDEHWHRIKQFSMEIHSHIEGGSDMHERVRSLLEDKGFKVYVDMEDPMTTVGIYMLWGKKQ